MSRHFYNLQTDHPTSLIPLNTMSPFIFNQFFILLDHILISIGAIVIIVGYYGNSGDVTNSIAQF